MAKILVVGSLNTDYVIDVKKIVSPGETILGHSSEKHFGGKGANQAVALARLGARVTMVGAVGKDAEGEALLKALKEEGIDTSNIQSLSEPSGKAFIQRTKEDNAIVVAPGANMAFDFDIETLDLEAYDMVVLQNEIPFELNERIIDTAYKQGVKVLYNPAPASQVGEEILKKVNLLVLNETEARTLTNMSVASKESINTMLSSLFKKTGGDIVLTRGSKGASYISNNTFRHEPAYKIKPLDTTGSGDATVAGLAYSLGEGNTIKDSVDFAQKCGALAATIRGAQPSLPTREKVFETKLLKYS